jgi:serine phosphatase RsbU (regulator of sigma subunit)
LPAYVFVATTDGITEARAPDKSSSAWSSSSRPSSSTPKPPVDTIVHALIQCARTFSHDNLRDDVAVVTARFL